MKKTMFAIFIFVTSIYAITVTQNPSSDHHVNPSGNLKYTQDIFFNWSVSEQTQKTCISKCSLRGNNYACTPCTPGIYGDAPCNSNCTVDPYPNSNPCTVSCMSGENVTCNFCTPPTPKDNNCSATCVDSFNGNTCTDICYVSPSACTGTCNLPAAASCNISVDNVVKKTIPIIGNEPLFELYSPVSECILHPWSINCFDAFGQSQISNSFTIHNLSSTPILTNPNIEVEHQIGGTPVTFNWSMGGGCLGARANCTVAIPGANIISNPVECICGSACFTTLTLPDSFACNSDWYLNCTDTIGQNSSSRIGNLNVFISNCMDIRSIQSQPVCKISRDITASGNCISLNNVNAPILDCNNHVITSSTGGIGIRVSNSSKTALKNCKVYSFATGIQISDSNSVSISETEIVNSLSAGLSTMNSGDILISSVDFNSNNITANIINSNKTVISDVSLDRSFVFDGGSNAIINKLEANGDNLDLFAIIFNSVNSAYVSNSKFSRNGNADSGGSVFVNSSNNINIENNVFDSDGTSILIGGSTFNITISKNTIIGITSSTFGVKVSDTSNSILIKTNNITKCAVGLTFGSGSSNILFYDNFLDNNINAIISTEAVSADELNESRTNILGCKASGGNAWFSQGSGFSENCSNFNNDCFCDEGYSIDNTIDFFPLTINKGLDFSVSITSIAGQSIGTYKQYQNKEYVAANNSGFVPVVINIITSRDAEFFCNSSLGGNTTINTSISTEGTINVSKPVGCYNITVNCIINITNASSQESVFCIDNISPTINFGLRENINGIIINPNDNEILDKRSFRLNISVSDSLTFITACIFELNGVNETFLPEGTNPQYCAKKRSLKNDTYTYKMFAIDAAGNIASTNYRTVIVNAPPFNAGCEECENIGNYLMSDLSTSVDKANTKIKIILYTENSSGSRIFMRGIPLLVLVKNATYENLSKVVTDENGSAYFSYSPWKNSAMEYTIMYCCFYEDCGFDKCLRGGTKISPEYIEKHGIYDINSVPDASPNQPIINYTQAYVYPAIERLGLSPEQNKGLLKGQEAFCIPVFLLFGLLLAALHYAGKNPFGFFDFSPLRLGSHIKYNPRGMQRGFKITAQGIKGAAEGLYRAGAGDKREGARKNKTIGLKEAGKKDDKSKNERRSLIGAIKVIAGKLTLSKKEDKSTGGWSVANIAKKEFQPLRDITSRKLRIISFGDKSGKSSKDNGDKGSKSITGTYGKDTITRLPSSGLIGILGLFGLMISGMKGGIIGGALATFASASNTQLDVMRADYEQRKKWKWLSFVPGFVSTTNLFNNILALTVHTFNHATAIREAYTKFEADVKKELDTRIKEHTANNKKLNEEEIKELEMKIRKELKAKNEQNEPFKKEFLAVMPEGTQVDEDISIPGTDGKKYTLRIIGQKIVVLDENGKVVIDKGIVDNVIGLAKIAQEKANDDAMDRWKKAEATAKEAHQKVVDAAKSAPTTKIVEKIVPIEVEVYVKVFEKPPSTPELKKILKGYKGTEVLNVGDKDGKGSHEIKKIQQMLNWMIDNKIIEGKKIPTKQFGVYDSETKTLVIQFQKIAAEKFVNSKTNEIMKTENGKLIGTGVKFDAGTDGKVGKETVTLLNSYFTQTQTETQTKSRTIIVEEKIKPQFIPEYIASPEPVKQTLIGTPFYGKEIIKPGVGETSGISHIWINAMTAKLNKNASEWMNEHLKFDIGKEIIYVQSSSQQNPLSFGAIRNALLGLGVGLMISPDMVNDWKMDPTVARKKVDALFKRDKDDNTELMRIAQSSNPDNALLNLKDKDGKQVFKDVGELYEAIAIASGPLSDKIDRYTTKIIADMKPIIYCSGNNDLQKDYEKTVKILDEEKTDPRLFNVHKDDLYEGLLKKLHAQINSLPDNQKQSNKTIFDSVDTSMEQLKKEIDNSHSVNMLFNSLNIYLGAQMTVFDAAQNIERSAAELNRIQKQDASKYNEEVYRITENKAFEKISVENGILTIAVSSDQTVNITSNGEISIRDTLIGPRERNSDETLCAKASIILETGYLPEDQKLLKIEVDKRIKLGRLTENLYELGMIADQYKKKRDEIGLPVSNEDYTEKLAMLKDPKNFVDFHVGFRILNAGEEFAKHTKTIDFEK